jgi:hypothetical protein
LSFGGEKEKGSSPGKVGPIPSTLHALDMVKLGLFIKAELDGVTSLTPVDTLENPYFYTFKVVCNSCHEVNDSWITISRQVLRATSRLR